MSSALHSPFSTAHPRSRGENVFMIVVVATLTGSSPLTRGKQLLLPVLQFSERLIPAHAGKTQYAGRSSARSPAHPRSRGENIAADLCASSADGSSPLTRGKRPGQHPGDPRGRLIPAHAGKTSSTGHATPKHPAHPRSRGENSPSRARRLMSAGSSPLTRGKPIVTHADGHTTGLIPAHAGKTFRMGGGGHFTQAHPRSRGENDVWNIE